MYSLPPPNGEINKHIYLAIYWFGETFMPGKWNSHLAAWIVTEWVEGAVSPNRLNAQNRADVMEIRK